MTHPELCPGCEKPLPPKAPHGLCPVCLLRRVMIDSEPDEPPAAAGERSTLEDSYPPTRDKWPNAATATFVEGATQPPAKRIKTMPEGFPEFIGRYRLEKRIGVGGMGEVILGRDVEIGREIALKVLKEEFRDSPEMVLRFVEESQIGGQLVHPAIVPVYERGIFPDARPFFVMKYVKGHTLADLLRSRKNPSEDLTRYLSIFDQVCQAMAYAHSRGVIHRDLKPLNIMVGAFGEVQTMDWGLAKMLLAKDCATVETLTPTVRAGSDASVAGRAKGTFQFMSPEQARGEVDLIDERADVFALGAILCEILTGRPTYVGEPSEILVKAQTADLADALARLDDCGADAELKALARQCLAPDRDDRPRNAGEVSAAMVAYFEGVQDRLRQAELDRVEAQTRAEEERKRRRLQAVLAAALLLLTTMGGLGAIYYQRQKSARAALVAQAIGEVTTRRELALAKPEDVSPWRVALASLGQAEGVAVGDPGAMRQLAALREELQAGVDAAERDKVLLDRIVDIRSATYDDPDGSETEAKYAEAFREARLDLSVLTPAEAGAKIKARPPAVALAVAAALDDWTWVRRRIRDDHVGADRLTEVARVADFDPWRNQLRATDASGDSDRRQAALKSLADAANFDELGAVSLDLLGRALSSTGDLAAAERVLRQAQRRHSGDVWINYDLGGVLERLNRRDDAIRFYTAARAVRPETSHGLADALAARGESDEAIEVFRELTRLRPKDGWHFLGLGDALKERGRPEEAAVVLNQAVEAYRVMIRRLPNVARFHNNFGLVRHSQGQLDHAVAEHREAIRLEPDFAGAHNNLGNALKGQGQLDQAVAEYREAIRLKPDLVSAHSNLGLALQDQGQLDQAVVEYREAIRLKPDLASAHNNLGNALQDQGQLDHAVAEHREAIRLKPDFAEAHNSLGITLKGQGKADEAEAEYREAIRLKPDYANARNSLGTALRDQGRLDQAVAEYREAIRLKPDLASAHSNLGATLRARGQLDQAVAEVREAIRLKPDLADARNNLGAALADLGQLDNAVAEFREAIRLKPGNADAHNNLGHALADLGQLDQAVAEFREAIRLKPDLALAYSNLGAALRAQGKLDQAIAAYREAIRLKPEDALTCYNLGNALKSQGQLDQAIAAYREAIRLQPDFVGAHGNLGNALQAQGQLDQAIGEHREVIRLRPDDALAHCNLAVVLRTKGDYAGSLAMLRKGHELGSKQPGWRNPSAMWVAQAEQMAALGERLPSLLKGDDHPKDVPERLVLAQMCYDTKRFAAAARFLAEALEADPKLGDDRQAGHRYNAACDAALASAGQGKDDPPPDDGAKAKLRTQALVWLKAEWKVWTKILESGPPQARPFIAQTLKHWQKDADLASIRDPEALAMLPEAERKEWQAFWSEVEALLKQTQEKSS
jgi:eukaryotic-like serine/threonine-protein kinase